MNTLGERIAQLIRTDGPMTIAQFMTLALHDPKAGYYARRDPIGADFITAPETTQIFGELLGLWCAQCWHDQGKPPKALLVELGPGRGTMMADALRAAKLMPDFLAAIEVVLVEMSPALQALQHERLHSAEVPLRWVKSAADLPSDRPLFLLANEFLDALPVEQYVMTERGWCERMVTADAAGSLGFALSPAPVPLLLPPERGTAEAGAVYEVSPAATALVHDIARTIARNGGAALFIDYGHRGRGFGETLQAVRDNAAAAILSDPGKQDLSAHVDFSAVARAAKDGRAVTYGPVAQGEFLKSLGIEARAERLSRGGSHGRAVTRLIGAEEMGTLFKVLAILPKNAPLPAGFAS